MKNKITKIHIKGFENHKDFVIELSDGINTLTGSSNTGKSGVIRSLNWCLRNYYEGKSDTYRTFNGLDKKGNQKYVKETSVKIWFSNGTIIERVKTSTLNAYYLNDENRGNPITSFNQSVPQIISNAINMNEICFQNQDDQKFLISERAGEKARILNKIVNMEKIEKGIRHINHKLKTEKKKLDAIDLSLSKAETTYSEIKPFKAYFSDFDKIWVKHQELQQNGKMLRNIKDLTVSVGLSKTELDKYNILDIYKSYSDDFDSTYELLKKYRELYFNISQLTDKCIEINHVLKTDIDISDISKIFDKKYQELEGVKKKHGNLSRYVNKIDVLTKKIKYYDSLLEKTQRDIDEWISDNKICSKCGQIICEDNIV